MQLARWLGFAAASGAVDYHAHGADWLGKCTELPNQSPINFMAVHEDIEPVAKLVHAYEPIVHPFELVNNGRALFADIGSHHGGGLVYFETWWRVMNMAFHSPGEHTFQGKRYPGEIHLLHQRWDSADFLVVAIPIDVAPEPPNATAFLAGKKRDRVTAPGFNRNFEMFLRKPLPGPHNRIEVEASDVEPLQLSPLIGKMEFYEYAGTLTAPPCANAKWMVRKQPMVVSAEQMDDMGHKLLELSAGFGNYREVQPLDDRTIGVRKGFATDPLPGWDDPPTPPPAEDTHALLAGAAARTHALRQGLTAGMAAVAEEGAALNAGGSPAALGLGGASDKPPVLETAKVGTREYRAMRNAKDALTAAKYTGDYLADLDRRIQQSATAHAEVLQPPQPAHDAHVADQPVLHSMPADLKGLVKQTLQDAAEQVVRELPAGIVRENALVNGPPADAAAAPAPAPAAAPAPAPVQ